MPEPKDEKDLNEMTIGELRVKVIKYGETIEQLRRDYLSNHAYCQRLMKGISTVLEPVVFYHLSPWVPHNRYINENEKKTILQHLAKLCAPAARVLAPNMAQKQLSSLVRQCYATFLESYDLADYNALITWKGHQYRIRDKKGLDPYVLQISGEKGEEKTPYHRAPLGKLLDAMNAESDDDEHGVIEEGKKEQPGDSVPAI